MKKYIVKVFLATVFMLVLVACTDDFEEMNTDPNAMTQVPYSSLVSNSQNSIARTYNPVLNGVVSWSRYNVRNVYVHDDRYATTGANTNFNYYSGHLKDLQVAMDMATEAEDDNWLAVTKILTAYAYQNITDWFGDVPYSEALMGDNPENPTIFPKYDSQQSIYADLIVQLKAANSMINVEEDIGSADIMFEGDMMMWKRFANSLLLRIYMRMSRIDPGTAQSGIEEIAGNTASYPVIDDVTNAAFKYWLAEDAVYRSPYYLIPGQEDKEENVTAEFLVDFMKLRNDTVRLGVYAEPAVESGEYVGLPLGTLGQTIPDLSIMGIAEFSSDDSPTRMMRYSEVLFIYAEAALNGWNVGMTAEEAYNAAIQASFDEYGIEIGDYLSEPNVDFNGGSDQRELIGDQKWCALYPDGNQGWAEIRRTGYPVYCATTEPVESLHPGLGVILRQPYPHGEAIDNPDALEAALAAQPGIINEKFGAGVWWDID